MANESENNINTFLENIPSLISEARRQMFCDNINVIEFMQRRIESNLQVLSILYDRCQGGLYDRQLQENIGILVTNLQELLNDYEQQWIENDTSSHFTCPVEDGQEDRRGRRRYVVPERSLTCLFQIQGKWEQVARDLGGSYRTLLRRRHEYGLAVSDTRGPRTTYTNISQSDLCNVVRDVLGILPNAGETFVLGALRQRGIHIQRWRVCDAICHVDPLTLAMRHSVAIIRRAYNVPCPNALW
jgi:hypothetical protein